jgi:hypothetical protein
MRVPDNTERLFHGPRGRGRVGMPVNGGQFFIRDSFYSIFSTLNKVQVYASDKKNGKPGQICFFGSFAGDRQ